MQARIRSGQILSGFLKGAEPARGRSRAAAVSANSHLHLPGTGSSPFAAQRRAVHRRASPAPPQALASTNGNTKRDFHGSPAAPAAATAPDHAQTDPASNPALNFPCLDNMLDRQNKLAQQLGGQSSSPVQRLQQSPSIVLPGQAAPGTAKAGPEPTYSRIVSGYSVFHYPHQYRLVHGGFLPEFDIAYETWGRLNERRDNAILIHTGLSASSHAKSHERNRNPGWWEKFIGPGLPLDTNRFFIICTNVIGGCYGSTGPSSVDPSNGERYATRFPIMTIFDMVRAQFKMLDAMGIEKLHASVGASMGGMQSLAAAACFPDRVGRLVSISACARSHPYSIAMRYTQRQGGV